MLLPNGQHLGYCTNVHPYADLKGLLGALDTGAGPLRERLVAAGLLDGQAPLGVGLWLPETAARQVLADPAPLRERLERLGLYAFTVNAFPQGGFHGARVKDAVFRPSWAEAARLEYTLAAARALALLLPEGVGGSVSTHTGGYKPWGTTARDADAVRAHLLAAADGLAALEAETGKHIVLALEPEPLSTLETTAEVVAAFGAGLHAGAAGRAHLGLCYDACHQAVEFEDMADSLGALAAAAVPLAKLQLSSAIRVPAPAAAAELLTPFAEDRWFHQVALRRAGAVQVLPDLPEALADASALAADEWRIHFHVPLFAATLDRDGLLATTRPDLEALLERASDPAVTPHLEIETYSFGMIPEARRVELGAVGLLDCLEREFAWVLEKHAGCSRGSRGHGTGSGTS